MVNRIRAKSLDSTERQVVIYRDDRFFTKNPDIVLLPSAKMLLVFNETDYHWPTEFSRVALLESWDYGRTWGNHRVIDEARSSLNQEKWVTPRISRLSDGRLIILCDHDDFRHCHESQPPGIYAWWSEDDGETWSPSLPTGIPGIEPDRVQELEDGTLLVGSHYMFKDTRKIGEFVLRSGDAGKTWGERSVVASDRVHQFCEGAVLRLRSGRLVCIMRENNHNNYPCYLAFSDDQGISWSSPKPAPFSGDRPFAGQLSDGRVLVTYRNQSGTPGLYAWIGDIEEESGYQVSLSVGQTTHQAPKFISSSEDSSLADLEKLVEGLTLTGESLTIDNEKINGIRYLLLPPENYYSQVVFSSTLKAEGKPGIFCGRITIARVGIDLLIGPDKLAFNIGANRVITHPDLVYNLDMTQWRELTVEYQDGKMEIFVDGKSLLCRLVYRDTALARSYFGSDPEHEGTLHLHSVSYRVDNPGDGQHNYEWQADGGQYPNQYEIDRWLELDYNHNPNPDHGYSSWLQLPDGRIFIADYTNDDASSGKAYLRGYYLRPEELQPGS